MSRVVRIGQDWLMDFIYNQLTQCVIFVSCRVCFPVSLRFMIIDSLLNTYVYIVECGVLTLELYILGHLAYKYRCTTEAVPGIELELPLKYKDGVGYFSPPMV